MKLLTDKEYLGITIPFMLSTMTQPLMGAVNTAVMGQLAEPKYIAAVSLGAILFNNLYWLFGFLRVSITGYAAQAFGAQDERLSMLAFFKPLVLAILVASLCVILQTPIVDAYLATIRPAADVAELCREYFYILIWGAPLVLFNYVALGWLMGQTRIRASVFMQVSMNVLNMFLSVWFVFYWHYDIEGVAWATLLSQIYGGIVGAALMYHFGRFNLSKLPKNELVDWHTFVSMLKVNSNLMIRTACLLCVNNIVAAVGASLGTIYLAVNAVLIQIKDIISFLIDGMANGTAIFVGKAVGERSLDLLKESIRMALKWLAAFTVFSMSVYYWGNSFFISLFTDNMAVIQLAQNYNVFVLLYPLLAGVGILLYGAFCGATYTAPIRDMMLIALVLFYGAQYFLVPSWGNTGLWIAYLVFRITQSIVLWLYLPKIRSRL
ncbi:MAG: MATE family efflux transporter [Phascolarctobacterium sp.]|nr:MATE family efflux transporter [Phascolarctobacterium sp.]